MKKAVKNTTNFRALLERDNKTIKGDRATRFVTVAQMDYNDLVNAKIKEKFSLENDLDVMSDLSTSNTTTTANRVEGLNFNSKEFVEKRASLRLKLALLTQEIKLLKEDAAFYSVEEEEGETLDKD